MLTTRALAVKSTQAVLRMAREEQPREDLLAEAIALVERAECRGNDGTVVVVGFRRNGSFSVFFNAEPVYQFNSLAELRRAYHHGLLYKVENRRLVSLRRERSADAVHLVRHELSEHETAAFLAEAQDRLAKLRSEFAAGAYSIEGIVPVDADVITRSLAFLQRVGSAVALATNPHTR